MPEDAKVNCNKATLRKRLREVRAAHVKALPDAVRALVFHRPPGTVASIVPEGAVVGLYHATPPEAPTRGYAHWLAENGRTVALPWFADRDSLMRFRLWRDPFDENGLEPGPWGQPQPGADAEELVPDVVFVPLLGFTAQGGRIGQGGGHYDRWLAAYPHVTALGLGWDCQLCETLPLEPHDMRLRGIVTPTRFHEGLT